MMGPRIVLADGHPVVRRALRTLLEQEGIDVAGEARDAEETLLLMADLRPDVVVLDATRPVARCLAAAREIVRTMPLTGVILVAFEDYLVAHAFQAGIRGYVLKSMVAEDLPQAIHDVASGGTYLSPGLPPAVVRSDRMAAGDLTPAP